MKNLAILGASGHGKVVADVALAAGWSSICFFDDAWPDVKANGVWDVIGDTTKLVDTLADFDGVIIAIGNCDIRLDKQERITRANGYLATLLHPAATISPYAKIGTGVVVMPGAVINAYASIGDGCIINSGTIIEHDCILDKAVHIAPGAVLSGNVSVGERSWIGVGTVIRQGAVIGKRVMVGAGAVVLGKVDDDLTVVGCPALPLRTDNSNE